MNNSIHQFSGDTPGKRQNVSCCTKTQLQIVFYFIFVAGITLLVQVRTWYHQQDLDTMLMQFITFLLIINQWQFVFPVNDILLYSVMFNNASSLVYVTTCRHKFKNNNNKKTSKMSQKYVGICEISSFLKLSKNWYIRYLICVSFCYWSHAPLFHINSALGHITQQTFSSACHHWIWNIYFSGYYYQY